MRTLTIGRGNFEGVAYSADGRFLVSLNSGRQVRFWDLGTFTQRLTFQLDSKAIWRRPAFAVCGERLVVGAGVWDATPAWEYLRRSSASPPPKPPCAEIRLEFKRTDCGTGVPLVATPDGQTVVGYVYVRGAAHTALAVWDGQGRRRRRFPYGQRPPVVTALTADGRTVATSNGKDALLLDLSTGETAGSLEHPDSPHALLFSPDGWLLAAAAGYKVWLWEVGSRKPRATVPGGRRVTDALAFAPDGRLLAAGNRRGEVRLWDTAAGRERACLDWRVGAVRGLAFSPDGTTAAAAGHDHTLVVWDVE
jgi:WD40 repeat protein